MNHRDLTNFRALTERQLASIATYFAVDFEAQFVTYMNQELQQTPLNEDGDLEVMVLRVLGGFADKKVHAIKEYRAVTKLGLKECKDFVENVMKRHNITTYSYGGPAFNGWSVR